MGAFHSGEFEGLVVAISRTETSVSGHRARDLRGPVGRLLRSESRAWSLNTSCSIGARAAPSISTAIWPPYGGHAVMEGSDVTLVAFGAMVHEAIAVAAGSRHSIEVWNPFVLATLDIGPILESVRKTGRLLVVQECGDDARLGRPCDFAGHAASVLPR